MGHVLYQDGKLIGEISDWTVVERPAEVKVILGKVIETDKRPTGECHFISPKPLGRRSKLSVIIDGKIEVSIRQTYIKGGTEVTAKIISEKPLR
jgi:hypothetical protein